MAENIKSSSKPPRPCADVFATTHWSLIQAARWDDSDQASQALDRLCRTYWFPLYAYLRRRGYREHDAKDLTQGLFAQLLRRKSFSQLAPQNGKFRSFLLVAMNHYLADQHERENAQKRGGGEAVLPLDGVEAEQCYHRELATRDTPETLYERRWAIAVVELALRRLRDEFVLGGKTKIWDQLHPLLSESAQVPPYGEVGRQLGMTEEAVKKAAQRLRRRFQELVRAEIANTVASPSEIEEELGHLRAALGG